jgi:hypothetical protein
MRHLRKVPAGIGLGLLTLSSAALLTLGLPVSTAGASYPPPTLSNTNCSFSEVVDTGSTLALQVSCVFAPNSSVNITANGAQYLVTTVGSSGVLTENFVAKGDPTLTLNGGPALTVAFNAITTFVATGTNPSGGTNTATTLVTTPTSAVSATQSAPLAFTGADLLATIVSGIALLISGALLTIYARRRARAQLQMVSAKTF